MKNSKKFWLTILLTILGFIIYKLWGNPMIIEILKDLGKTVMYSIAGIYCVSIFIFLLAMLAEDWLPAFNKWLDSL